MKKTFTINLGGIVFHIDEDAYDLLSKYLENLRLYFNKTEGKEEIIADIESRFADLFNERITHASQSIVITDVEDIIKQVGSPEEIYGEEEGSEQENDEGSSKKQEKDYSGAFTYRKKLFRNPDDKVIGGVASGVAAYFKLDPLLVRLIFLILLFFTFGTTTFVYLIMWILIPLATTAIEKLNMCGEDVTVENIGKRVSEDADKVNNPQSDYYNTKNRSFWSELIRIVGMVLKGLFLFFVIILSPVWLVVVIVLMALVFALLVSVFAGGAALVGIMGQPFIILSESTPLISAISGLILAGIPLGVLLYLLINNFKAKSQPISTGWKWGLFILWVIALIVFIISAAQINWVNIEQLVPSIAHGLSNYNLIL